LPIVHLSCRPQKRQSCGHHRVTALIHTQQLGRGQRDPLGQICEPRAWRAQEQFAREPSGRLCKQPLAACAGWLFAAEGCLQADCTEACCKRTRQRRFQAAAASYDWSLDPTRAVARHCPEQAQAPRSVSKPAALAAMTMKCGLGLQMWFCRKGSVGAELVGPPRMGQNVGSRVR
jgi:hypothetical protein